LKPVEEVTALAERVEATDLSRRVISTAARNSDG
jgi:hypothetical protein